VSRNPNELHFSFLTLKLLAKGPVAFIMAGAVCLLIIAIAWRVAMS
jgi:hypothetical protein